MIKLLQKLIFMILLSTGPVTSTILTENKITVDSRWLVLKENVVKKIQTHIKTLPKGVVIEYLTDSCPVYDASKEGSKVQICVVAASDPDNSISLEFRNPNNRFELSFQNINIDEPNQDIKIEPYIDEFTKSLDELVLDPADKIALIEEALKSGITAAGGVNAAIATGKITYQYKGKDNTIIYTNDKDLLVFSTDFFQDSIDLNIPLKKFISFETKKLIKDVVDHLYLMQQFALSDGETTAQSIKTLTCQEIFKDNVLEKSVSEKVSKDGLTVASTENSLTISKDGKQVVISCTPVTVGDFGLVEMKADFGGISPTITPIVQTFLSKSLYNLLPVVNSFVFDVTRQSNHMLSDTNSSEDFEQDAEVKNE